VPARFDDQRRHDCQRERYLNGEARPCAGNRLHVDHSADLIDVVADDIHADTTAGYVGDFRRRGKTRRKYELVNLGFRQLLRVELRNQALRDGFCLDLRGVEPTPIIRDANDNVAALVICREADQSVLRLADGTPLFRRFKAVIG
jgi:hypothetical protein